MSASKVIQAVQDYFKENNLVPKHHRLGIYEPEVHMSTVDSNTGTIVINFFFQEVDTTEHINEANSSWNNT